MKKIVSLFLFFVLISSASAFEISKDDFLSPIGSKKPRLLSSQIFKQSADIEFNILKPQTVKSFCLTVDPKRDMEDVGQGMVIRLTDGNAVQTWWYVPYLAGESHQRWCFSTKYSYAVEVFWDDNDNKLSFTRMVSIHAFQKDKPFASALNTVSAKGKPLVSNELHARAIQCGAEFCSDQGFVAPNGNGNTYVETDMANKRLKFNFSGAILADLFQSLPVSLDGAVLCLRSNTAGWSGISEAYCTNFVSDQEMIISLPINPSDMVSIVDEEFTFAVIVPGGQSYWTNNANLFPHTSGLIQSGDNFKVAP